MAVPDEIGKDGLFEYRSMYVAAEVGGDKRVHELWWHDKESEAERREERFAEGSHVDDAIRPADSLQCGEGPARSHRRRRTLTCEWRATQLTDPVRLR
jgi:hypothetical protein